MSSASRPPVVLCVHQSAELYGSDRMFAMAVVAIRENHPDWRIVVHLPADGPLRRTLESIADQISVEPMWVLRKATLRRRPWDVLRLPRSVVRTRRSMREADLVYVNTIVVFDHLIAARLVDTPTVAHIHEVASGRLRTASFSALLRWSRATIICNSRATAESYDLGEGREPIVVHNGVADPSPRTALARPAPDHPIHVFAPGRLHPAKGHHLLIDAIAELRPELRTRTKVRIVGDTFGGDPEPRAALERHVTTLGLDGTVEIGGFQADLGPHYEWSHIVVQASSVEESFGLVAAEGMAHGRAVVVTDAGALSEVVGNGEAGLVVPVGDPVALTSALEQLMLDPDGMVALAQRGRARYEREFTEGRYGDQLSATLAASLDDV